jgi:predicted ATP-grasp superfamily ATP-dependent carboligase
MKLLVFEYATAMGVIDPLITAEGHAMLHGVLDDLKDFKTYYLVSNGSETIETIQAQSLHVHGDIKEWLNRNIKNYDACLPIAPEEDNILYDLTLIIEKHGVPVLGSSSNAVKKTTNKFDMYNALNGKVPVIKTERILFKDSDKKIIKELNNYGSDFSDVVSKIAKPADGVSCSGVYVVDSSSDLLRAKSHIQNLTLLPYFILQDYIPGISASVSLLSDGKTAVPLSLNFQNIRLNYGEITYIGGTVPLKHKLSDLAMETAKKAVESIDGIKGYVGVDIIIDEINDQVHVIEINSRITTPYIAIRSIINFNLGEAIINAVNGKLPSEVRLNGMVKFYKEGKTLRINVIK